MCRPALLVVALALSVLRAQADERRNWFDDPFFQITSDVPQCAEPAGPRVTEAERQAQSHRRAEKGTTCWLAKEEGCERANAYSYDRDIASEIKVAVRTKAKFPGTSLWVTVQGRVVYVEGCVSRESQAQEVEAFVRSMPYVQQAVAIVSSAPGSKPPYKPFVSR
ncbi:BON domain-containing protein [Piscinibacter defluvii]|uniref:BON domain-containing protein n=1 Tax=Piscinibacter defluvii TaxID=1796922 RepID=UPI0013E33DEA|nr:BON domain-containing protein [Piscinibacter defluvii]